MGSKIYKEPFRELIKKYRSITLKQIEDDIDSNPIDSALSEARVLSSIMFTPYRLTGFGGSGCILCRAFNGNCMFCYGAYHEGFGDYNGLGCLHYGHEETYYKISHARDAEDLLNAFNERANHIEKWLKGFKDGRD